MEGVVVRRWLVAMAALLLLALFGLIWLLGDAVQPSHSAQDDLAAILPSPSTSSASPSVTGALREVHSPGRVTDDMNLTPSSCRMRESDQGEPLPDPACTPGAVDPAVTQDTIKVTICVSGWTATVRPSSSDTGHWKLIAEANYGDSTGWTGEYDHLVPLELGGANSVSNLWPEPGLIPNGKDRVEGWLKKAVCAGAISLHDAQAEIAADWTKVPR
jgi:hypothetical protein